METNPNIEQHLQIKNEMRVLKRQIYIAFTFII